MDLKLLSEAQRLPVEERIELAEAIWDTVQPGQKVQVIPYGDRIELVPVRPAEELRGFLANLDNTFERENDRL